MNFSKRLHDARIQAKLTQRELAQICGLSLRTVTNYETGRNLPRSNHHYIKLADALGVDPVSLKSSSDPIVQLTDKNSAHSDQVQALFVLFSQIITDPSFSDYSRDLLMYGLMQRYWSAKGFPGCELPDM